MDASSKAAGDTLETSMLDKGERDPPSEEKRRKQPVSPLTLKQHLRETYGRRSTKLMKQYFRSMYQLATYTNNITFLTRCHAKCMVPHPYRVECTAIINTREVVAILDQCGYQLMLADLNYNRLRKVQVSRLREHLHQRLKDILSPEDLSSVVVLAQQKYENTFEATKDKQRSMFAELLMKYELHQTDEDDE